MFSTLNPANEKCPHCGWTPAEQDAQANALQAAVKALQEWRAAEWSLEHNPGIGARLSLDNARKLRDDAIAQAGA